MTFPAVRTPDDIQVVAALARAIWPGHYAPFIGREAAEYIVGCFQSNTAIRAQILEGYEYFLIEREQTHVGYFAMRREPQPAHMFLSKLYVSGATRGLGVGAAALHHVESVSRAQGLAEVWLTVHQRNPSVQFYQHHGFEIVESIMTDFGNGYLMEDYRMRKTL